MKKLTLLFLFMAVTAVTIAQVQPSFGVRAGISSSGIHGDATDNLKNLLRKKEKKEELGLNA